MGIRSVSSPWAGAFTLRHGGKHEPNGLVLAPRNIEKFRKQLADTTDQVRRQTLLELLASEEDKDKLLPGNTA